MVCFKILNYFSKIYSLILTFRDNKRARASEVLLCGHSPTLFQITDLCDSQICSVNTFFNYCVRISGKSVKLQ
jgi:hypothetical protein